jgi:hypothetical protein
MKRAIGVVVLLTLAGALGSGWYFFYGPVQGLKIPAKPSVLANEAPAAEPSPESANNVPPQAPSPTIAIEPSSDEIEGFPAQFTIRDGSQTLAAKYTGQFRRTKEIIVSIKIYDIASYVVEPTQGKTLDLLDGLLVDGKAKVYMIRFLNNLPGRPLMNDIYKDINSSFTDVDVGRLKDTIDIFCSQFKNGSRLGDVVYMVWLSDGRVYSAYNSASPLQLLVHDVSFARALWRNWAGPRRGDLRFNLVSEYAQDETP